MSIFSIRNSSISTAKSLYSYQIYSTNIITYQPIRFRYNTLRWLEQLRSQSNDTRIPQIFNMQYLHIRPKKNICVFPISRPTHHFLADRLRFLAPPAERQRSFSNTDLSVVRLSVCLSVRPSVCLSVCPSRLRGGGVYLRNASVTFLLFWHEASFGWHKSHI